MKEKTKVIKSDEIRYNSIQRRCNQMITINSFYINSIKDEQLKLKSVDELLRVRKYIDVVLGSLSDEKILNISFEVKK